MESQRRNAAARIQSERDDASKARKKSAADNDDDEVQKKARRTYAEMSMIKSQSDLVSEQLRLYREHKESYVTIMGEEKYHKTILDILKKLPDADVLRSVVGRGGEDNEGEVELVDVDEEDDD
jgi:uncharacterized membrane protein YgaE (UPF0421/DUF939 family)